MNTKYRKVKLSQYHFRIKSKQVIQFESVLYFDTKIYMILYQQLPEIYLIWSISQWIWRKKLLLGMIYIWKVSHFHFLDIGICWTKEVYIYYSLLGWVVKIFEYGTSSHFKNRVTSTLWYSLGPGPGVPKMSKNFSLDSRKLRVERKLFLPTLKNRE